MASTTAYGLKRAPRSNCSQVVMFGGNTLGWASTTPLIATALNKTIPNMHLHEAIVLLTFGSQFHFVVYVNGFI